jgi:DNA-binding NtrC family response regulator
MQSLSIVIAERDPAIANLLVLSLDRQFRSVELTSSVEELESVIPRRKVDAAVVDLETVPLPEVTRLTRDFHIAVICTHRIPDEKMWAAALAAGALDVYANRDAEAIARALDKNLTNFRSQAA